MVKEQLDAYIELNHPLHESQHGFVAGRSDTTNAIVCDSIIALCRVSDHPYDILSIDFQTVFDKVSHDRHYNQEELVATH